MTMIDKVPTKPRYRYATQQAEQFLIDENIRWLPIDPMKIATIHKWKIKSLTQLLEKQAGKKLSEWERMKALGTFSLIEQNAFVAKSETGRYTIIYNDFYYKKDRILFTLMHEIGHIVLKHLEEFEGTKLSRGGLGDEEYNVLEKEADCFARNVLAPFSVVVQLKNKSNINNRKIFGMSKAAWNARIDLFEADARFMRPKTLVLLLQQFYDFVHIRECGICKASYVSAKKCKYCPICGSQNIKWSVEGMKYPIHYQLDKNGKAKVCPRCENEELEGSYCNICGTFTTNMCTATDFNGNPTCEKVAAGNARYCIDCGEKTTFFRNGLLKSWEEEHTSNSNEPLPF